MEVRSSGLAQESLEDDMGVSVVTFSPFAGSFLFPCLIHLEGNTVVGSFYSKVRGVNQQVRADAVDIPM